MKKQVVIYTSKYGTTKKYAQWIAEELQCDLFDKKDISIDKLTDYNTIIYGGGLYAGGISGVDLISKNFNRINDKNIILFTCGLADPTDQDNLKSLKTSVNKALPSEIQDKVSVFHLRGGIDYSKLGFIHKAMMHMLYKAVKKRDYSTLREEDKQMLDTYGKTVDFTDKIAIEPIVNLVKRL